MTTTFNSTTTTSTTASEPALYLTFPLVDGLYGIGILDVSEIRGVSLLTALPGTPPYVRGVMNLRGAVIPVIDLRVRLGLPPAEPGKFAVTIITKVNGKSVGLLADGVQEVVPAGPESIRTTPALAVQGDRRFVKGLALKPAAATATEDGNAKQASHEDMIVLLDLERLYDSRLDSVLTAAPVSGVNESLSHSNEAAALEEPVTA